MKIIRWLRSNETVQAGVKNDAGEISTLYFPAKMSDAEIMQRIGIVEPVKKAPETVKPAQKEPQGSADKDQAVTVARDAKADAAKLKAQYIAELAKAGIDMKYERNFEKVKAAYHKMKQEEKKGGK
ncbi:MAG: hypothetical protein J6T08_08940 [Lentisphaeria bacterium]|nr:hypothetical protein [Lentisphaeria bacterium]